MRWSFTEIVSAEIIREFLNEIRFAMLKLTLDDDYTHSATYSFTEINSIWIVIRKTCPCNVYPLKPHFYIVKLGYAGVYHFFLFLLQNIDCGYSLTCTHNLCFEQK